jgi:Protein of unknown function (DUF4019)
MRNDSVGGLRVGSLRLWVFALIVASSFGAWAQQRSRPRRDAGGLGQDDDQARQENEAKRAAALAAGKWLEICDAGNFAKAFEETAPALAKAIDSQQWEAATSAIRTPLGRVLGRRPATIQYLQSEPTEILAHMATTTRVFQEKKVALPYREWALLQCQARFENARGVMIETLQLVKDDDGTWKVIGIRIQEGR